MSEAEEMAERLFVLGAMLPSEHARGMISTFIATAKEAALLLRAQAAEIKALKAKVRELSDDEGCCAGCGSTMSMEDLRKRKALSCCPERKMLSAKQWRERAVSAEALVKHWKMRAASARNNTLEEVARKLEADGHRWAAIISAEIRAMKEG